MNSDRIKELQLETACPESRSVHQALLQVWNECEQELRKELYTKEDLQEAFIQGMDNMDYSDTYGWSSKLTEQEWFEYYKKQKL
jgi:hypothetical protein